MVTWGSNEKEKPSGEFDKHLKKHKLWKAFTKEGEKNVGDKLEENSKT